MDTSEAIDLLGYAIGDANRHAREPTDEHAREVLEF
jgi:hypothetical protein